MMTSVESKLTEMDFFMSSTNIIYFSSFFVNRIEITTFVKFNFKLNNTRKNRHGVLNQDSARRTDIKTHHLSPDSRQSPP